MQRVSEKQLSLFGFLVMNLLPKYRDAFFDEVSELVAKGEIRHKEDVSQGLKSAPDVMLAVLKGTNSGKAIVLVSEE